MGLYLAYDRGAETAILVDNNGNIAEGPGFNVFTVKDGAISTPDHGVLMGITRQTVIEICAAMKISCVKRAISPDELRTADEVFITSTAGGVMPVTKIDETPIGSGLVGSLTTQITKSYWQMHEQGESRTAIRYPANAS